VEYKQLVEDYLTEVRGIADTISVSDVISVANYIYNAWRDKKWVYLCGNGGSASTASHFTNDLVKIGVKAHCLDDNPSIITAVTNDDGFDNLYLKQIEDVIVKGDVLVCLSVHGGTGRDKAGKWSQNLLKAVEYAQKQGAYVLGLVGFDGGVIRQIADASIVVGKSTPQTESWHVHMEHLIVLILKEMMAKR
jgi:D-sedoheptulose 7-phosphate isomerase